MKQRQTAVEKREIGRRSRLRQFVHICPLLSREPLSFRQKAHCFARFWLSANLIGPNYKTEEDKERGFKERSRKSLLLYAVANLWTFLSLPPFSPSAAACRQSGETKMNKTKLKAIIVWKQSSYLHGSVCLPLPHRPQVDLDKDLATSEPQKLHSPYWGYQM